MSDSGQTSHEANIDPAFIGRGFYWPVGVDHTGGIAMTSGPPDLDRSIEVILLTAPGERVMRPEFGCRIWELMFEPVNANTIGLMAQAVREAVAQWEPRVTVRDVQVAPDPADHGRVDIHLTYEVRTTNDVRNLVHPFYVIPREGEETE